MTTTDRRVLVTVLAAQALRGLGYGLAAVQLGAVLRDQGLDAPAVGLVLAAIVAGSAAASLALGRWARPRPQLWVAVWGPDRRRPTDRRRRPALAAGPGRAFGGAVDRGGRVRAVHHPGAGHAGQRRHPPAAAGAWLWRLQRGGDPGRCRRRPARHPAGRPAAGRRDPGAGRGGRSATGHPAPPKHRGTRHRTDQPTAGAGVLPRA